MKKVVLFSAMIAAMLTSCNSEPTLEDEANTYGEKYCAFFDYNKELSTKNDVTEEEKKKLDDLMKDFDKYALEMEKKYAEDKEKGPEFMKIAQEKMAACGK